MDRLSSPGILAVDPEFRITAFSQAAQRFTGYAQEEVLGKRCFDIFCDPETARQCPLRRSLDTGEELEGPRLLIRTRSQDGLAVRVKALPVRNATGQVVGAVESLWPLEEGTLPEEARYEDLLYLRGRHPQMQRILDVLPDLARSDAPVLISGEIGTGKGFLARRIHRLSGRGMGPWVRVDCGAYKEEVLEVELFGCRRSAIHGIEEDRPGRIQLADGGTLFLQEIDRLPIHLQVKLMRFLQDGEIEPFGGRHPFGVDARLIAASHTDLKGMVKQGLFREDLFFRLNVFILQIPPLREMREAIPHMIGRLIKLYNEREGKGIRGISGEVVDVLRHHPFPGNVRELDNLIHHAHILCRGDEIQRQHLPDAFGGDEVSLFMSAGLGAASHGGEVEKALILAALNRNQWSRKRTAQELGLNRSTLWRRMRKLGLRAESQTHHGGVTGP